MTASGASHATLTTEVRTARLDDLPGIREVQEACLATDGIPGFERSDIDRAMVRIEPDLEGTVVVIEDGRLVGYCTPNHDDLTVHPDARRRGHGRRLVPAALEVVRSRGSDELELYVPTHLPASVAFATALGFHYRSSLWQFELERGHPVAGPVFPEDVELRPFSQELEGDIDAWVAFMLAAFEGHPTTMHWTPSVIAHINAAPDFDPTSIAVLTEAGDPRARIGFARIETFDDDDGGRTGYVGLIGVLPAWRRRGLGRELLRWSVAELRRRDAGRIELSVEADNERATALYRAHGFEPAIEWPHWVLPTA
jgi:mycothiol synthase